ncbi:MAG: universal stress protein [Anaerolineae bacterium]|nr:universal stress protein [Anaerolineae bacterium]
MYKCILVSLDGSRASEAVLPAVEKILQAFPTKVVLLRVGPNIDLDAAAHEMDPDAEHAADLPGDEYELLANASELEIRRYLDGIANRLQETGATPIIEVSFNKPADEILFFARHYEADLIAMATHARTGLNRLLHGSVAENVLHHAACPVLLVREPDERQPQFAPPREAATS